MFGIIELIFSLSGIIGYFNDNTLCMIIGLIGIIICDLIDTFISGHNPTTIIFAVITAIGATIANHDPLYNFTIILCGENFIVVTFGFLIILIGLLVSLIKDNSNNNTVIINSLEDTIHNSTKLQNVIDGVEQIEQSELLQKQNPYTGETIQNYEDIILYLKMYQLDAKGINPMSIIK